MTGILYHDDSEVVRLEVTKRYAALDAAPGVAITITSCAEAVPVSPQGTRPAREAGLFV